MIKLVGKVVRLIGLYISSSPAINHHQDKLVSFAISMHNRRSLTPSRSSKPIVAIHCQGHQAELSSLFHFGHSLWQPLGQLSAYNTIIAGPGSPYVHGHLIYFLFTTRFFYRCYLSSTSLLRLQTYRPTKRTTFLLSNSSRLITRRRP